MRPLLLLLAILSAATACGPPSLDQLEVKNTPNVYTISVELSEASGSREDAWSVNGDRVWVSWAGTALLKGSVSLELSAPEGLRAYRESARVGTPPEPAASELSSAGTWTVRFFWSDAKGPLRVSITGVQ